MISERTSGVNIYICFFVLRSSKEKGLELLTWTGDDKELDMGYVIFDITISIGPISSSCVARVTSILSWSTFSDVSLY